MQIVLRENSGLGNQLFRYAALRYYAKRYRARMRIAVDPARYAYSHGYPRPFLLRHFSITVPIKERSLFERLLFSGKRGLTLSAAQMRRLLRIQIFSEPHSCYYTFPVDLPLDPRTKKVYLDVLWQSHVIVDEVADELRAELSFRQPAQGKNLEVMRQIELTKNAVSLHVRRGDARIAKTNRVHLPLDYYRAAISLLEKQLDDTTFFVFSDDIAFAREFLPAKSKKVFIEHNDDFSAHEDLRLMSACRHHIIANSTFSWWGAWLNPNPDKIVVAPKYWHHSDESYYPELLPRNWILIDVLDADSKSEAK